MNRCTRCGKAFGLVRKYLHRGLFRQFQFCSNRCRELFQIEEEVRVRKKKWISFLSGLP